MYLKCVSDYVQKINTRKFFEAIEKLGINLNQRAFQFEVGKNISNFVEEFHHLHPSMNGKFFELLVFAVNKFPEAGEEVFEAVINELERREEISPDYRNEVLLYAKKKEVIEEVRKVTSKYLEGDWKYQHRMSRRSIVGVFDFSTESSIIEIKVVNGCIVKSICQLLAYSSIRRKKGKVTIINFGECEIREIEIDWSEEAMNNYLDWLVK